MLTRTLPPDTSESLTVSQRHLQAANHLNVAARAHMEAAKLFEAGDQKAAELQVDIARVSVLRAGMQVIEAGRKTSRSGLPGTRLD